MAKLKEKPIKYFLLIDEFVPYKFGKTTHDIPKHTRVIEAEDSMKALDKANAEEFEKHGSEKAWSEANDSICWLHSGEITEDQYYEELKRDPETQEIVLKYTLGAFHYGCDKTNYQILQSLPNKTGELAVKFGMSNKSMNERLKDLEVYGLVDRAKGTGIVISTEMSGILLNLIDNMKMMVNNNLSNALERLVD